MQPFSETVFGKSQKHTTRKNYIENDSEIEPWDINFIEKTKILLSKPIFIYVTMPMKLLDYPRSVRYGEDGYDWINAKNE